MHKVKLWKIKSNHNNLRTDTIEGECGDLPKIGEDFVMYAKALSIIEGYRFVRTTTVKKVIWDEDIAEDSQVCLFKTENSTYLLFIQKEEIK